MAQTGYTPILIYSSSTVSQAPAAGNLTNSTLGSELAINITDGKLFYKDNGGSVQVIAWKTTPTTAGGTGLTSYTAGDLLYYASGTALSKLAIGTAGQWLGSSGTAPQWNSPAALTKTDDTNVTLTLGGSASTALLNAASLTLGWTGTLAVSRGGTGTGTAFTAGSVLFAGASGVYSQDNANFFWDDANNRLGIGSNAPKAPLDVKLAAGRWMTTKYDTNITLSAENDSGNPENMRLYGENIRLYTPQGGFTAANLTLGAELFSTTGNFQLYTGNLVIGTSGKGIDTSGAIPIVFSINTADRGRFAANGYFKATSTGTYISTAGVYHEFTASGADYTLYNRNTNAAPFGTRQNYSGAAPNGTGNEFLVCDDTGATRATIRSNGGLANYQANNVNLSDRREKTNFAPAKSYLETICAIPVQTFNYIDQNMEEDPGTTLGVVAQDVQAVAPELVMESNWAAKDQEPKMRLSVYETDFKYALMKALQELKAQFDEYKASHP